MEIWLHKIAKALFQRERRLTLPAVDEDGRILVVGAERQFAGYTETHRLFPRLSVGLGIAGFRPDAIGSDADGGNDAGMGEVVLVEFRVTHAVHAAKWAKAEALGLAMVEINLSGLVHHNLSPLMTGGDTAMRDAQVRAILMDAPR